MDTHTPPGRSSRNWWKYAFFVALFAFEVVREVAVVGLAQRPVPNGSFFLFVGDGLVSARGRWLRTDGGGPLVPTVVAIECRRELGQCIEASVNIMEEFVHLPEIDWFDARFANDAVTYENDIPECSRYLVRIDLRMRRVLSVRERKPNATNPNCAHLEPRLETQLGDAYQQAPDPSKEHFVPILSLISALI